MEYPLEILPKLGYKLIDCDLSNHFLIRFTNTNDLSEIWDTTVNRIKDQHICPQGDHIYDLSMSLLGIYTPRNIFIELTQAGSKKFGCYCAPDEVVGPPIFQTEFNINGNRHYWWISVARLHNVKFSYTRSGEPREATCYVRHTPMRWNYWHFSLRWNTDLGELENIEEKLRKKVAKRIGYAARVIISQSASINPPTFHVLAEACYKKN